MKFTTFLRSLLVTALTIPTLGQAHYFRSSKLSNNSLLNTQEIITFGDFHNSSTPENKQAIAKQAEDTLAYAKALNAAIIVEDGVRYVPGSEMNPAAQQDAPLLSLQELEKLNIETPIHGLFSKCVAENISCRNVEFRYTNHRPLNVFCKLLENKKAYLLGVDDGASFNAYYRKKFTQLEQLIEIPCKEFFDRCSKSSLTIDAFCQTNNLPQIRSVDEILKTLYGAEIDLTNMSYRQKLCRVFKAYCCAFIDLEILHAIAQYKDHKTIFICAGDFHIECIKDALIEIGYYHQATHEPQTIEKDGLEYLEPTAIDVEQVLDGLQQVPSYPISQIVIALCGVMVILGCAIVIRTLKPILL